MENNKQENIIGKIRKFLKETEAEARKIIWPDKKYVYAATLIVLVIVIISSVFVMIVDFGFIKIFEIIVNVFKVKA